MNKDNPSWFDNYEKYFGSAELTPEIYDQLSSAIVDNIDFFKKHIPEGSNVLDVGCALGNSSISLSKEGYVVLGSDLDLDMVRYAKINGKNYDPDNFGTNLNFAVLDINDLDVLFKEDFFEACVHAGLIEHFTPEEIPSLLDKQFKVAKKIVGFVPLRTEHNLRNIYQAEIKDGIEIHIDGQYRNLWPVEFWINDIFKDYEILDYRVTSLKKCFDLDVLYFALEPKEN